MSAGRERVLADIRTERERQIAKHGPNDDLQDGTGPDTRWLLPYTHDSAAVIQIELRRTYEEFEDEVGKPTFLHVLLEELAEAFEASTRAELRDELVQVAAVAVNWIEHLDARA